MKILAYINKDSSPAYHRIVLPIDSMEVEARITNDLHSEYLEGVSIFTYNRILPEFAIEPLQNFKKLYGFKVCVDVDDFWILDKKHPYYNEYQEKRFATLQIKQLQYADFVTVTNERLAQQVKPYNKNVHTLPNAIPQVEQFIDVEREPHPKGLTRLFWQGSSSHLADMIYFGLVAEKLKACTTANFIEMVLAGYDATQKIWNKIAGYYTAQGQLLHGLLKPINVQQYYATYREADICLAPLLQSHFNGMKSNLKVLEAANLKLPVICSKVNPYLNLPVAYAETPSDWLKQINRLVFSKQAQAEEGEKLHEYCNQHFNFYKINEERKQIFKHYSN